MGVDPTRHRKSIRLRGYDYGQAGAYFVTVVTDLRACLFGQIVDGEMRCNPAGQMVKAIWESLPRRFPSIEMGAFARMPNHFHGIVVLHENVGATLVVGPDARAGTRPAPTNAMDFLPAKPQLGAIVGAFKSITTLEYMNGVDTRGWARFDKRLWQRNYYEHIIRDANEWNRIHLYIEGNPSAWAQDEENPANDR